MNKYVFESPVLVMFSEDESDYMSSDLPQEALFEINETMDMELCRLETCMPMHLQIKSISGLFKNTNKGTVLLTTVLSDKKLTKKEINELSEALKGQFSDGWGECFEQNPAYSSAEGFYFLHTWTNSKSYYINLIEKD